MKKISKRKLHQLETIHRVALASAFAVIFGISGIYLEHSSHAATGNPEIKSAAVPADCITVLGSQGNPLVTNAAVDLATCSGIATQNISISGSGSTIQLVYAASNGNHCLEPKNGILTVGTAVVSNSFSSCATEAKSKAEYWKVNGTGFENIGALLCLTTGSDPAASLTLAKCAPTTNTNQQWLLSTYTPPVPTPIPTSTPTPTPVPVPTPTPAPVKVPPKVTSTVAAVPPPAATVAPVTAPTPTVTPVAQPPAVAPTMQSIREASITHNSITLSWKANGISSYVIKFGESPSQLTHTSTVTSSKANESVTLSNLPAGKNIYVTITPSNKSIHGTPVKLTIKTVATKSAISTSSAITIVLILFVISTLIVLLRRKANKLVLRPAEVPVVDRPLPQPLPPSIPPTIQPKPESTESYDSRVNWWLTDEAKQKIAKNKATKKLDDVPDMFDEGRKRLEDEEKNQLLPK